MPAVRHNVRSTKTNLEIIPHSWFSWDFRVLENGVERAVIDKSWVRERGTFVIDGETYTVGRTSVLRGTFALECGGRVVADARKPSVFFRSFEIAAGTDRYTLRAASIFRREFLLLRQGKVVGAISPVSMFGRHAEVTLPEEIQLPVQLFIVFLVLVLWKRAARRNS